MVYVVLGQQQVTVRLACHEISYHSCKFHASLWDVLYTSRQVFKSYTPPQIKGCDQMFIFIPTHLEYPFQSHFLSVKFTPIVIRPYVIFIRFPLSISRGFFLSPDYSYHRHLTAATAAHLARSRSSSEIIFISLRPDMSSIGRLPPDLGIHLMCLADERYHKSQPVCHRPDSQPSLGSTPQFSPVRCGLKELALSVEDVRFLSFATVNLIPTVSSMKSLHLGVTDVSAVCPQDVINQGHMGISC